MSDGPRGPARTVRHLSLRAAVSTGGALMVAGQLILVLVLSAGAGLPALDGSALLALPAALAGVVMLWIGPVVVSVAAGRSGWLGAVAFPGGCLLWILGTLGTDLVVDDAVLTVVEGALPVVSFAGALAVVGGGRVWLRLAGVAVIAGLTGALGYLVQDAPAVVYVGLVAAIGSLAWVAPRAHPSRTSASSDAVAGSPHDGR
jgi:hypothetical protein